MLRPSLWLLKYSKLMPDKSLYWRRVDAGLCGVCGKLPPLPDRRRCVTCAEKSKQQSPKYVERKRAIRNRYLQLKQMAFDMYGGAKCACCGETIFKFLTLDHINNDGAAQRKKLRQNIYQWLKANSYPPGFRVLCYNCNCGRAHTKEKECPHLLAEERPRIALASTDTSLQRSLVSRQRGWHTSSWFAHNAVRPNITVFR